MNWWTTGLLIATPLLSGAFAFVGAISAVKAELRGLRRDVDRINGETDTLHARINRVIEVHRQR